MADLTDRTDNVSLTNDGATKVVTVTTDGSKERLDVDANVKNADQYVIKSDVDTTGDVLGTGADTSLFSFTGAGAIDFVALTGSSANYEFILKVDGTERLRISANDVGSVFGLTTGNVQIWAENASKNFRYTPNQGVGFTTSFEILARATSATPTVTHLCLYRERV